LQPVYFGQLQLEPDCRGIFLRPFTVDTAAQQVVQCLLAMEREAADANAKRTI
jgi:hypothetical protein